MYLCNFMHLDWWLDMVLIQYITTEINLDNILLIQWPKWIRKDSADSEFSKIILDLGDGKCPETNSNHNIELPISLCQAVADTETLIQSIYDDIHNLNIKEDSWMCDRLILAPTNDQVTTLNQHILNIIYLVNRKHIFPSIQFAIWMKCLITQQNFSTI